MHIDKQIINTIPKLIHVFIQERGAYKQQFSNCFFTYIFSGKNTKDNHLSTLAFVICHLPVTLFIRNTGDIDTSWLLIYCMII